MKGKYVTCESKQGSMDIYVSRPHDNTDLPVMIVLQEAFGVNHHIRDVCDRLAHEGFIAAAPELFHREGKHLEVSYSDRDKVMSLLTKLTNDSILSDVRETINFLEREMGVDTRKVNTLGFCVGGFASTLCAAKLNVNKMISFYGAGMVHLREGIGLHPFINSLKEIKSQCLFFYGEQDSSIPLEEREYIKQKLKESKVKFEIKTFPSSGHGYFCDERGSYNAEDAKKSWEILISFLKN